MNRSDVVLEGREIVKTFGGVTALAGVSLHVCRGEILGLIGPNGSGKSTLLHCLGGSIRPTSGTVEFGARKVTGLAPHQLARLGLSRTFQQNRIFRELTVMENVLASAPWGAMSLLDKLRRPRRAAEDRARHLLDRAGLLQKSGDLARDLSGGQQRLLEIAMALMPEPSLLMLDEATSGVNPRMIDSFVRFLLDMNAQERCAMVLVEHNLQFITNLAERIVALDQGVVLAAGPVDDVLSNPDLIEAYLGT